MQSELTLDLLIGQPVWHYNRRKQDEGGFVLHVGEKLPHTSRLGPDEHVNPLARIAYDSVFTIFVNGAWRLIRGGEVMDAFPVYSDMRTNRALELVGSIITDVWESDCGDLRLVFSNDMVLDVFITGVDATEKWLAWAVLNRRENSEFSYLRASELPVSLPTSLTPTMDTQTLSFLKEQPIWDVAGLDDHGSLWSFSLGGKIYRPDKYGHKRNCISPWAFEVFDPEFILWVDGIWRIMRSGKMIDSSPYIDEYPDTEMRNLVGHRIIRAEIMPTFDLRVYFSNDTILDVFNTQTDNPYRSNWYVADYRVVPGKLYDASLKGITTKPYHTPPSDEMPT
jgi:hypothetical protein